jgi:hypothetical protein
MPGLIFNTGKIYPRDMGGFWAWPRTIHLHFLTPIPTAGLSLRDLGELKETTRKIMMDYYVANKALL